MRKAILLLAAGSALAASAPAFAQLGSTLGSVTGSVGAGVNAGVDTTIDAGSAVDRTTNRVGTVVSKADRTARRAAEPVQVRNVAATEIGTGTSITDSKGNRIGTVSNVTGNTVTVVDGKSVYKLPVTQLYAFSEGAADRFAARVPKASLKAEAHANANSRVNAGG